MKLKVDRTTLLKALAHIQSVAEKRNTIPILANVLLKAEGNTLVLTATDTEIMVVETIDALVQEEGATTVSAAILYDIVRKLRDGVDIELEQPGDDNPLHLRSGRFATSINTLDASNFSVMADKELSYRFKVSSKVLQGLIEHTRFAISTEETRYYLNGIYLHVSEGHMGKMLRAVATDGHRLARIETEVPEGAEEIPGIIIPRKTVYELYKLLDEAPETIQVALSDNLIEFVIGHVTLKSKLIDGTFPEYERVIPQNNDRILRVGKEDFSSSVARVAAISQERSCPVKLSLKKGLLTLIATSQEQGTAEEQLDEEYISYEAEEMEIGFQARYLNDITDQVEKDVEFSFSDSSSPALIKDIHNPSVLYVLMPMRV
ncbi:DNA polymerase III subunit beta [Entomobacter blattae]|uniref:Beta sliding clamp n=1 Tax=Entomobacter blattae TaxID=2762277 RepID=A0A7H1NT37_9PROT|nr:DNA polymerase III subunit beta [Entomobacter blattae]QNT78947.1 Beta sliding clamp [Entomobacter blattae]